MPSRALTVTLNYQQGKNFALLLSTSPEVDLAAEILREARNKFRTRKLTSVFLPGGLILAEREPLPELVSQVWVGKGEPYCGPPAPFHGSPSSAFDSELHLIRWVPTILVM